MPSVAIEIGAGLTDPIGPGYVYGDGSFHYVPVPESDSTVERPKFSELNVPDPLIEECKNRAAMMNPEFPSLPTGERATYAVTSSTESEIPSRLKKGDYIFFYTQLRYHPWDVPKLSGIDHDTDYYIIGQIRLARDPVIINGHWNIPRNLWRAFSTNAVRRRQQFEALALILGETTTSGLYDAVLPMNGFRPDSDHDGAINLRINDRRHNSPIFLDQDQTDRILIQSSGGRTATPMIQ